MASWAYLVLGLVLALALIYAAGPREPRRWRWARHQIPEDPQDLDAYLAGCEAGKGIKPGLEKQIDWIGEPGQRSTRVLVYFHGFTASRYELDPVPQQFAKALEANAYYVRFAGHCLDDDGHGIAKVRYADWVNDVQQALKVACKLGDEIIVMSCSTGGSMATWAAQHMPKPLAALIFVSPNYQINNPLAFLLTNPWARALGALVEPPRRGWTGEDWWTPEDWQRAAYIGTMEHDSPAVFPVAVAALTARRAPFEEIKTPALFLLDPADKTVRSSVTQKTVFPRWGGPKRLLAITCDHSNRHVLCGKLASPRTNAVVLQACCDFIADLQADKLSNEQV